MKGKFEWEGSDVPGGAKHPGSLTGHFTGHCVRRSVFNV